MSAASCFISLATALVVTFTGPNSMVNITSPGLSNVISSMVIQFKTSQSNSQIVGMMSESKSFAINVRSGLLKLQYNFNETGNGSINFGSVNTNKWFLLNITTRQSITRVFLSESDNSISTPCGPKSTDAKAILLGQEFSNLIKTSGFQIGGATYDKSLSPFEGCIGLFSLGNINIDLRNISNGSKPFKGATTTISKGCPCAKSPCVTGFYIWDRSKGKCDCKCNISFHGEFCQNRTMSKISDDADSKFLYIIAGVAVGVILLVTCVVCIVVYIKRTSSSVFGVYNPKSQEQMQGQQMKTAFTLPVPEKLI